ncbi:unnamed protein product [Ectocarpus sp. 12 AP-2014]
MTKKQSILLHCPSRYQQPPIRSCSCFATPPPPPPIYTRHDGHKGGLQTGITESPQRNQTSQTQKCTRNINPPRTPHTTDISSSVRRVARSVLINHIRDARPKNEAAVRRHDPPKGPKPPICTAIDKNGS